MVDALTTGQDTRKEYEMNNNDRMALYTMYAAVVSGLAILFKILDRDNPMIEAWAQQMKVNDDALSEWAKLDKDTRHSS
jgi:hypothetical protein